MLAEMKQNELRLVSQDLWGSTKSISDMISKPHILVNDYLETHAADTAVNGFEIFGYLEPDSPDFGMKDWSKSLWQIGPD